MLDYISKQLQSRMPKSETVDTSDKQMDEAVLEYAHLFQELDDLSMAGTEAGSSRPYTKIDIPVEDDIEVDSVELNLLDGRVTDIPMDATVQEEMLDAAYSSMRTFDTFYAEAYHSLHQYPRETKQQFETRVYSEAEKAFENYSAYVIQEGLFGFDKMSINSSEVPGSVTLRIGQIPGKNAPYYVKLPVYFEVDNKHRILKKQLQSIQIIAKDERFLQNIDESVLKLYGEQFNISSREEVWNIATPIHIIVPINPVDRFIVSIVFEFEGSDESKMMDISWPMSKGKRNLIDSITRSNNARANMLNVVSKRQAMQEMAIPKRTPNRFFQEAIDMGDPDEAPAADTSGPTVSVDEAPPAEGGVEAAPPADPTNEDPAAAAPEADADNTTTDTNDVSDQIAEKVAENNAEEKDPDVNLDDIDVDAPSDADIDATTDDAGIDAELGESDDTAESEEALADDMSNIDFDNMTIDELLEQGSEKLKGMTIQQLRDFLSSPDGTSPDEVAQEAFFITRGNVGKELDIHLRKALGILNNDDMEINELCAAFRKEGKILNRVVHKASKMKKLFDESEITRLQKLNHCLSDLIALMGTTIDPQSVMIVKRLIQAFVSEATAVSKIIETKNNQGTPVQEMEIDEEVFQELSNTGSKRLKGTLLGGLLTTAGCFAIGSLGGTVTFLELLIAAPMASVAGYIIGNVSAKNNREKFILKSIADIYKLLTDDQTQLKVKSRKLRSICKDIIPESLRLYKSDNAEIYQTFAEVCDETAKFLKDHKSDDNTEVLKKLITTCEKVREHITGVPAKEIVKEIVKDLDEVTDKNIANIAEEPVQENFFERFRQRASDKQQVQEGFFDIFKRKKPNQPVPMRDIEKIELKAGELPADLKEYLTSRLSDGKTPYQYTGTMFRNGDRVFIVSRPIDSYDIVSLLEKDPSRIALFDLWDGGKIGYSIEDKGYFIFDKNDKLQLGSTLSEALSKFKTPDDDDTEYIEVGLGRKLPEDFKRVFKSKEYQSMIHEEVNVPIEGRDDLTWTYDFLTPFDVMSYTIGAIDDNQIDDDVIVCGMFENNSYIMYRDGKVTIMDSDFEEEPFEEFIKRIYSYIGNPSWESRATQVQESYHQNTKSFDAVERKFGRKIPEGYQKMIHYGIENLAIKGVSDLFSGCEYYGPGMIMSVNADRSKFDYDGHPGSEFIVIAGNGRGDEILLGNSSKTDERVYTYIHDEQKGLKQIAANWDDFEKLLYTKKDSDSEHDKMSISFFGTKRDIRIPRGISLGETFRAIDAANKCATLLNDKARKKIADYTKHWQSEMSDDEIKSIDWKNPEKHLIPAYIYPNKYSNGEWSAMLDCDWEFDKEHGIALIFDKNLNAIAVGQPGNYL